MSKTKKKSKKKSSGSLFGSIPKNKKGQMGTGLMTGMFVAVLVFVMLSAFLPVIIQMLGTSKGSNSANCANYVDPAGTYSYNSTLASDTITCSILNFTAGIFTLSIVFAIISGIIAGKLSMGSPEPQQYGYQQY
jgi:hypothetical protein